VPDTRTTLILARRSSLLTSSGERHAAFTIGRSAVTNGSTALPGAFSITNFFARNAEEVALIKESDRKIAMDMLSMPGFITMVSAVVGDCLMTITAWETRESMAPLMKQGEHRSMISRYLRRNLARAE